MKIPETEVTGKQVSGWIAVVVIIVGFAMGAMGWIILQSTHRNETIERWEEYDTLWEQPVEERRETVKRALDLLEEQEAQAEE